MKFRCQNDLFVYLILQKPKPRPPAVLCDEGRKVDASEADQLVGGEAEGNGEQKSGGDDFRGEVEGKDKEMKGEEATGDEAGTKRKNEEDGSPKGDSKRRKKA
jgi:hypothetical protein